MRLTDPIAALALMFAAQPLIAQSPATSHKDQRILTSLNRHATTDGLQILTDTQGVDFGPWLKIWHAETERTWQSLIPAEVNPPKLEQGTVAIRFKVFPNGRLGEGSMELDGHSGYTALNRAAWGAVAGSEYPSLPRDFHGPYLELRAYFFYNKEPQP
jgi:hypothetical protein